MRALPRHSGPDAFTVALGLALVLHAAIFLLVGFDWYRDRAASVPTSLDVILVDWASDRPPEEADFLAQADQRGGGDSEDPGRPVQPVAVPDVMPQPEAEPETAEETSAPEPVEEIPVLTAPSEDVMAVPEVEEIPEPEAPAVDTGRLVRESRAQARITPEMHAEQPETPERPRRRFISANTQEHLYAGYMRAWVSKVERVGNLNYPEAARRSNLEGSLVMSVDVQQDGSVTDIQVLRSSGHEVLDEAAVRIVRLSAPFAPLPDSIREEVDVLTITRTWQFSRSGMRER